MSRLAGAKSSWDTGGRPLAGPRIAVTGNCQARAVAGALRLLLPEASVVFEPPARARHLPSGADVSVFQRPGAGLPDATHRIELPILVFAAFHPDLVYIQKPDKGPLAVLRGPVGDYHSALAFFGFTEGLSLAETEKLFRPEVYARLGYLDLWDQATQEILEAGRVAGWDLSGDLMRWARRGTFMHSTNHPRPFVIADLAREVARRAGLPTAELDTDGTLRDELLGHGGWPVYPAVAERYGVAGNDVFLAPRPKTRLLDALLLPTFLERSFATYARAGRERLLCPRVDGWRADAAVKAYLLARARRSD